MLRYRSASLVLLLMADLLAACAVAPVAAGAAGLPAAPSWKALPTAGPGAVQSQLPGAWGIARIKPALSVRPSCRPILDTLSRFGSAVILDKPETARTYMTPTLQADKTTVDRMLGLSARPHRFSLSIGDCDTTCGMATLTFFFPDGRSPVVARLDLSKFAGKWRIAGITHLAG